jgi:hypothetical protein
MSNEASNVGKKVTIDTGLCKGKEGIIQGDHNDTGEYVISVSAYYDHVIKVSSKDIAPI